MTSPAAAQSLHCANGDHAYTRAPRRGPKPRSCDLHPNPVPAPTNPALAALLAEGWPQVAAERALRQAEDIVLAGHLIAARHLLETERLFRRHALAHRQALRDSGSLVPDDRSHQRQQADLLQARKDAEAETWMSSDTGHRTAPPPKAPRLDGLTPPAPDGPRLGGHKRRGRDPVPEEWLLEEGTRKGADRLSTQIRRGAMHTGHAKSTSSPATCSECWLIANDPNHLAHRAS